METSHSTARKLIPILIASSVRRCQLSGVLCRLTISLKFFHDSNPPSVRISISDTGIGSSLVEFQDLNIAKLSISDKWGGVLSITTTGIHDKEIHHYRLNLKENLALKTRLKRLPPTQKNAGTFSGTELCLSTSEEEKFDELMAWVVHFIQKMLVLKDQNVSIELIVEHIDSQGSSRNHLLQQNDDNSFPTSSSCIESLACGLENYVLKHGNIVEEKCQTCAAKREQLKVGTGQACSTGNGKGAGQMLEVGIVMATSSLEPCCWRANSSVTQEHVQTCVGHVWVHVSFNTCLTRENSLNRRGPHIISIITKPQDVICILVLYFQDFSLSTISHSSFSALISVDWQSFGLKLKSNFVDREGHAVLEWENMPLFAHIDIAIHSYNKTPLARQQTPPERNLIKKAVKNALEDLKAKYTGLFLSSHALKVREYAPDLSRAIAGLIMSSNDLGFQSECASLLGLDSAEAGEDGIVESCIRDNIMGVIEMNDRKIKGERSTAPYLFECENLCEEEECLDEDSGDLNESNSILDF